MRRLAIVLGVVWVLVASFWHRGVIIEAQTLPYLATYTWTAPADGSAVSYNCYLDGTLVTNVTVTTCQVSIPTLGAHTAAVTSVNPNDVPSESAQDVQAFTLKQPSSPTVIKVK